MELLNFERLRVWSSNKVSPDLILSLDFLASPSLKGVFDALSGEDVSL